MEEIIRTLVEMDPSMISQYVDYFFLAIAAVGLIGFIVGFIKGFYKESTTFILTAVYFVLLAFVNKWISSAIYELDITSFVPQLPEGVKTVGDYLNYILLDLCEKNGITISNSQELVNAIVSIALAFVNLVVYLVLLLAGIIIVGVVDFIAYFLIVRLIVPKSARKYRKKRLFGGGLALIRYVVAFSLLLSPFTAIVNSTVGNLRDENGKVQRNELDNDFYNALMNVLEGYNNSTVAKVFFIVEDEDGRSIDVRLMDYITKSKIDEETAFSLYNEIGNLGSLAIDAVSTGFIQSTSAIDLTLLLQAEFVGHAIDTLAKSTLVQTVLSVGVTLAVNMDKVKEFVDLSSIDFMQVDWSSTLNAVSTAYEELYETGLVDEVIENPETFLNDFYLDGDHANGVKNALRSLGDNELICKIMPPLIASFISSMNNQSSEGSNGAKRSDNFEIPDALQDPDTYKDIRWGSELANLYEVLENLSKQYYGYENEHLTFNMINTLQPDVILNALFGTGIDFSKEDDTSYKQEYERNVFVYGGEYVNEEVTHKLPGVKNILGVDTSSTAGLLNLQIIDVMFEKDLFNDFISLLDLNQLLSLDANKIDLNEEVVDVVSDWEKEDWQNELSAIVDVVCPIMKLVGIIGGENATVSEAKRAASEPEIDLDTILGDDSLNCLKRVTDVLVDSQIFNEILPDVLEVYTDDMQDELIEGLALSDLNFTYFASNDDSMVKELRTFIDDVDTINEDLSSLLDDITGENAIDALVSDCAKDQSVLGKLLKIIKDNQILNKPLTPEEKLNDVNTTFTNVMIGLLSNGANPDNTMNIYNMTDGMIEIEKDTIVNFDKNPAGWDNEIDGIIGFIGSLKDPNGTEEQVILDFVSGKTSEDFDLTNEIFGCGNEIERIFASVDDSVILKEAFPKTFEGLLGDTFKDVIGENPDFYNVDSWASEGHYFNLLLGSIDDLREGGQDLSSIDWMNVEEAKLTNILTSLYNTQSVGGSYVEDSRENGIFHSMLKNIISQALENLEINIESDVDNGIIVLEEDVINRDFDIDNEEKVIYKKVSGTNVYVSWLGDSEHDYDGEIKNIVSMIGEVKDLTEGASIEDMQSILEKVNNCYILRNTLGLIIDSKTESLLNGEDELMSEFIDRSDFEVFHKENLSMTPYEIVDEELIEGDPSIVIKTREDEINARQEELNSIVDIINDAQDIGDKLNQETTGETQFDPIKEILVNKTLSTSVTNEQSSIEAVLNNMHNSEIFNAVESFTNNDERTSLTAFEYFFQYVMSNDALNSEEDNDGDGQLDKLLNAPTDEYIYSITEENGWINTETQVGEITNFNNGLYNFIENPLIDIVLDTSLDFIDAVEGTLKDDLGNPLTPIQDMLLDLHSSKILDLSTGKIIDDYILKQLLKALDYDYETESNNKYHSDKKVFDNRVSKIDQFITDPNALKLALVSFGWELSEVSGITEDNMMEYVWRNEGKSIESLIGHLNDFKFDSFDMNDIDSDFIDEVTISLKNSFGLNYLETTSSEYNNSTYPCRSAYQLLIIKITDTSVDAIEDALGLDDSERTTTSEMIKDYDHERNVIVSLIDEYNNVKDIIEKPDMDSFSIGKYSEYDGSSKDDLDKIDGLIGILDDSEVYNYEYERTSTSLERNIYERMIMKLVNTVKTGFESSNIVTPEESEYTSSYDIAQGEYDSEKQITFNIARRYKDVEELLEGGDIVNDVNDDSRNHIEGLVGELEDSKVFNYTQIGVGHKENDNSDHSYYEHIVIYMIEKTNDAFEEALELDTTNSQEDKIISYNKELDVILDVMQAYQSVSSNFENSNSIDFDAISDKEAFMLSMEDVLKPLHSSDVYHYVRNNVRTSKEGDNQLSNLSIFEQMIYTMLSSSSEVIENLHIEHTGINYSEVVSSDKDVLNLRIREVSESDLNNEEVRWWDYQVSEDTMLGEVTKIRHITGEDFGSALDTTNGVDLTGLIRDIENPLSEDGLLNLINKSFILHDTVPNIIEKYIDSHEAEEEDGVAEEDQAIAVNDLLFLKATLENGYHDYSNTRGYAGEHVDTYRIDNHDGYTFLDKVEHWDNDLYHVSKLIELLENLKEAGDDINQLEGNFFQYLFDHLAQTETYHMIVPQITISILNDYLSVDIFGTPYGLGSFINGHDDVEKLSTYFYIIDNHAMYLLDESKYYEEDELGNVLDYTNETHHNEGLGIDMFVKYLTTLNSENKPSSSVYALGGLMMENYDAHQIDGDPLV